MKRHWATPASERGKGHEDPKRNQGNAIVEVFDKPEGARCKEDSEHPELWEPNYVWRPEKPYRSEDPMDPWAPAMEIDPATRPETMKLAKMMVDRIPKKIGLQKITPADPECWGLLSVFTEEAAISQEEKSADVEHLSYWLKKYDRFSSAVCSCRMSETVRGVNTGDDPEGWCIGVGDMADYEVQTGKGRYITYDEAMEIIQKAEDLGFVHQITNIDGSEKKKLLKR